MCQIWFYSNIYQLTLLLKVDSGDNEVPRKLWHDRGGTVKYSAAGGRDVLILAPDLSLPHPEAVPKRPGQLTQEDKLKLQRQGVLSGSYDDELVIINSRYALDKECKIVQIKSGQGLSQEEVLENIHLLLTTTKNDGGKKISDHDTTIKQNFYPMHILKWYRHIRVVVNALKWKWCHLSASKHQY